MEDAYALLTAKELAKNRDFIAVFHLHFGLCGLQGTQGANVLGLRCDEGALCQGACHSHGENGGSATHFNDCVGVHVIGQAKEQFVYGYRVAWGLGVVICNHVFKGGIGIVGQLFAQHVSHKVEIAGTLHSIAHRIAFSSYPLVCHRVGIVAAKITKIGEYTQAKRKKMYFCGK